MKPQTLISKMLLGTLVKSTLWLMIKMKLELVKEKLEQVKSVDVT